MYTHIGVFTYIYIYYILVYSCKPGTSTSERDVTFKLYTLSSNNIYIYIYVIIYTHKRDTVARPRRSPQPGGLKLAVPGSK